MEAVKFDSPGFGVRWYFLLGGIRNIFGIALITYLTSLGISVSLSLLIVMLFGFILYMAQVRYSVGLVDVPTIVRAFIYIYCVNRLILWGIYQQLGLEIYYAQFISIALLSTTSFLYLKRSRINTLS